MSADSDNATAFTALDRMIEKVRTLPQVMLERAAQDVAAVIERELAATLAAGATPEGEPWTPRKADGGRALAQAQQAVHVAAIDGTIFIRLVGIEVRHHRGRVRGGVKREVIPTTLPAAWVPKITAAISKRFDAHMTGHGSE